MAARAAGAGGNYDYLVKLLLIGDSGSRPRGPTPSDPPASSAREASKPVFTLTLDIGPTAPSQPEPLGFCAAAAEHRHAPP